MQFYLAETDLDPRIILAVIFVVFGGLKWLFENVLKKEKPHDISSSIEDIYEQYRAQIVDKQTQIQQTPPPPPPQVAYQKPKATPKKTPTTPPALPIPEIPQLTLAEKAALARIKEQADNKMAASGNRRTLESTKVRQLLKTPGTVRTAMILQDILGGPKSLR